MFHYLYRKFVAMRIFFIVFVVLSSCNVNKTALMNFAKNPVVAHRGAFKAKAHPENSIASLRYAIELGCTGSEFDVWMTADDSLILNHDPGYTGKMIEKSTYATLAEHPLLNGESLPLLRNFLLAGMKNNHQTRLVLEIKPSRINKERGARVAEKVVTLVKELNAERYITYISFDYNILLTILKLDKTASTQYLSGDKTPEQVKADGISGIDYHYSVFKEHPEWITAAKQNGLQLNAWTVNETADMDWLLEQGFDFITTNEPELLLRRVKQRKTM
jgi:glycerophosphoryl diester phosphodiesterase